MTSFLSCFSSLTHSNEIYLDSAATTHRVVYSLQAMDAYYQHYNANVHRGNYLSAQQATNAYETARKTLAEFINAPSANNVVFSSGATESLNIIASGLQTSHLVGNKILVCMSEHHANLLPWQNLSKQLGLELQAIKLNQDGSFCEKRLQETLVEIDQDVALVAIAHVSNVLGNVYPIKEICAKAKEVQAISVIDGTQAAAHLDIDVQDIGCDFYVLSGHKMYAGTGIGILYGQSEKLAKLQVSKFGGEMITRVTLHTHDLQEAPLKFEAGTPNISGALGMAAAATFIKTNLMAIKDYEHTLYQYLLDKLQVFIRDNKLKLIGNTLHKSISLLSLYSKHEHANDIASFLASRNIAIRAGHHCAMPLMQFLNIQGCLRVSIACYTKKSDIDELIDALNLFFYQEMRDDLVLNADEKLLKTAKSWTEKHRLLLIYSKQLPLLAPKDRIIDYQIEGCEANVWLALTKSANATPLHFVAYSDSKVVRGILALLVNKVNLYLASRSKIAVEETPKDMSVYLLEYLQELGVERYFSQGRRDGVKQIIKRINQLLTIENKDNSH